MPAVKCQRAQMWMATKIKTPTSPTIDAVKSQVHITDVFRVMTLFRGLWIDLYQCLLLLPDPSHNVTNVRPSN
jgi:hypothetical protein